MTPRRVTRATNPFHRVAITPFVRLPTESRLAVRDPAGLLMGDIQGLLFADSPTLSPAG